jgi:hypothetical protein
VKNGITDWEYFCFSYPRFFENREQSSVPDCDRFLAKCVKHILIYFPVNVSQISLE